MSRLTCYRRARGTLKKTVLQGRTATHRAQMAGKIIERARAWQLADSISSSRRPKRLPRFKRSSVVSSSPDVSKIGVLSWSHHHPHVGPAVLIVCYSLTSVC
ncbi:hypothetical protein V3C99_002227 [Haemonchus contortus]